MRTLHQIISIAMVSVLTVLSIPAQVKVKANEVKVHELEVVNQLSSQTAVVNMPVSQLLNAPGNEELRAFFFLTSAHFFIYL